MYFDVNLTANIAHVKTLIFAIEIDIPHLYLISISFFSSRFKIRDCSSHSIIFLTFCKFKCKNFSFYKFNKMFKILRTNKNSLTFSQIYPNLITYVTLKK